MCNHRNIHIYLAANSELQQFSNTCNNFYKGPTENRCRDMYITFSLLNKQNGHIRLSIWTVPFIFWTTLHTKANTIAASRPKVNTFHHYGKYFCTNSTNLTDGTVFWKMCMHQLHSQIFGLPSVQC